LFSLWVFGPLTVTAAELEGISASSAELEGISAPSAKLEGISAPSADIMLSFVLGGRVAEVLVKDGDFVKKNQLLARLDDKTERIQLTQLKAQAKDKTLVQKASAEWVQKKADSRKIARAKTKGAATDWEVQHARLAVKIALLALQASKFEHEQYQRTYRQAQSQLKRMQLVSPIAGRVEKTNIEAGEAAESLVPVIQVVKIDPLWIDLPVPLEQVRQLRKGNIARVSFPGIDAPEAAEGIIIHVSRVADAASDTLRVRVEVPNPDGRPAGERVFVEFIPAKPVANLKK
jgi:RND family efflux transporter MFP subunit